MKKNLFSIETILPRAEALRENFAASSFLKTVWQQSRLRTMAALVFCLGFMQTIQAQWFHDNMGTATTGTFTTYTNTGVANTATITNQGLVVTTNSTATTGVSDFTGGWDGVTAGANSGSGGSVAWLWSSTTYPGTTKPTFVVFTYTLQLATGASATISSLSFGVRRSSEGLKNVSEVKINGINYKNSPFGTTTFNNGLTPAPTDLANTNWHAVECTLGSPISFSSGQTITIQIKMDTEAANTGITSMRNRFDEFKIFGTLTPPSSCTTPTAYNVTGTGAYCSGGSGVAVGLSNSETGVTYQLKDASNANVGSPVNGSTSNAISFGNQTAGTYTVVATRTTGGCTATMTGSAVVTENATVTPSVTITANPGNTISSGTSVTFTATPTNGGSTPSYQWKKGATNVGSNQATYTDAGLANGVVITCVMTSNAACASPTTATSNGITMTVSSCPSGNTIYVDNTATGTNDGSSWANAFTDLNDALDLAYQCSNISTINVAGGSSSSPVIYKPTHKPYNSAGVETTTADARDVTFQIRTGLAVYGGFPAGGGTRDPKTNVVILDGDIDNDNNLSGNVYHTVLFVNPTVSSVLDGFVIKGGNANGTGSVTAYTVAVPQNKGGGIYCEGGNGGVIRNCEVRNNYALSRGAGMFMTNNSNMSLEYMNIRNNVTGAAYGGGIAAISCTVHLLTSLVHNNGANSGGGVIMESNVILDIKNSVITANSVTGAGGAGVGSFDNSNELKIINSIIYQNSGTAIELQGSETLNVTYSNIQGWLNGGTGVLDADPIFLNPANPAGTNGIYGDSDDGFSLGAGSPCVGIGGTPTFPWLPNDFAGKAWGGNYDIGAYVKQFSCPPSSTTILYVSANAATNGNGLSDSSPMQTLGEALDMAWKCPDIAEIRVAEGNYIPTHKPYNMGVNRIGTEINTTDDRDKTFHIRTGLKVSGGYNSTFTAQDVSLYPSFLSGSLGVILNDAAYHVVVIDSSANWASNSDTTILSHFYVLEGNANNNSNNVSINGISVNSGKGGGIYTTSGTNKLYQLTITANNAVEGGGCYLKGGNLLFSFNSVDNNTSSTIAAGAYFDETNINYFTDNNFNYNNATTFGGGAYFYHCDNVKLDFYYAANNQATHGAGMYIKECNNVTINVSSFYTNTATDAGSAIYCLDATNIVFSDNIIDQNIVSAGVNDGGAVTFNNTTATMNFNTFDNNTSGEFGGAIHLNTGSVITVGADAYRNNTALKGGAIAINNAQLNLENSDIVTNISDKGGAIYAKNATTNIKKVVFSGNFNITFEGGAIYSEASTDNIINCIFNENMADDGNGGSNGKGGAIYNKFSNQFLANNTFHKNNASSNGGALFNEFAGTENYLAINNLFYNNRINSDSTAAGADIEHSNTTNLSVLKNNLMQFGSGAYTGVYALAAGSVNNVYNPTALSPFLDASDPDGLTDYWRDGDDGLQLGAGSLAINAGTATNAPTTDIAGATRVGNTDIGAYEYLVSCINPTTYNVTGTGAYCAGSAGLAVGLDNSETGVTYQLKNGATDVGSPVNGSTGNAISFGNQTAGTYTVVATRTSDGCMATMTGSAIVVENPAPSANIAVTNNCGNSTLNLTTSGSVFLWSNAATTEDITVSSDGAYSVTITDSNGCTNTSNETAAPKTVTTASIAVTNNCGNSVLDLTSSPLGVGGSFLWSNGATTEDITVSTAGLYTVTATANNGCSTTASETAAPKTVPTVYDVTGGGAYCAGEAGINVGLNNTQTDVDYFYKVNGSFAAYSLSGDGSPQNNLVSDAGDFTIIGTHSSSGCTATMNGSVTVTVNAVPTNSIAVTNNCGNSVLDLTTTGTSFLWSNGATTEDITVSTAGTYTVTVTAATGGCTATTSETAAPKTVPTAYNVTGGGAYCAGETGIEVGLNNTQTDVDYFYKVDGNFAAYSLSGDGSPQNNLVSDAGNFTIIGTHSSSGCTATMNGSVTVIVNAVPTNSIAVTNNCGNSVLDLTTTGTSFLWSNGATTEDITVSTAGTYTVTVTAATGGCTAMTSETATPKTVAIANAGADVTLSCASPSTTLMATGGTAYVWDNGATQGGSVSPTVTTTYTVTVTAANGCTATDDVTITANPIAVCLSAVLSGTQAGCPSVPANLTVDVTGGTAPYTVVLNNGTSDITVSSYQSGANIPVTSTTTTTYTLLSIKDATNIMGNVSGTATVTIDNIAPMFTNAPAELTVSQDSIPSFAAHTFTATDNVSAVTITNIGETQTNLTKPNCFITYYRLNRVYQASDACGNTATATQSILVGDQVTMTCPSDKTLNTNNDGIDDFNCSTLALATNLVSPTYSDECSNSFLSFSLSGASTGSGSGSIAGARFNEGVTQVRYTSTVNGMTIRRGCVFNVTVKDDEAPKVVVNKVNVVLPDCDFPNPLPDQATGSDNCSLSSFTMLNDVTADLTSTCKSKLPTQKYSKSRTITWRATDAEGLITTATQVYYLLDNVAPIASCKNDITVTIGSSNVTVSPSAINNMSSDNCSSPLTFQACNSSATCTNFSTVLTFTKAMLGTANSKPIPVNLRVLDACNNSSTCATTVLLRKAGALSDATDTQDILTDIADNENVAPTENSNVDAAHGSLKCYPNPFSEDLNLEFNLTQDVQRLVLKVYDNQGRVVETSERGEAAAGFYQMRWNLSDLAPAMYHVCLELDGKCTKVERVIMMK